MKLKIIFITAVLALCVVGVVLFLSGKSDSGAKVSVRLRVAVTPGDQARYVAEQAGSARFKYLVGKSSGVKPALAQRLSVKLAPNTSVLEAEVRVPTEEAARRYVEIFLPTLQGLVGKQARVGLLEQSIR